MEETRKDVDARGLYSQVTIRVRVYHRREMRFRWQIAAALIELGARISGMRLSIEMIHTPTGRTLAQYSPQAHIDLRN